MKLFIVVIFIIASQLSVGYCMTFTCPTVAAIKRDEYRPWLPLYVDNEELASLADIAKFKAAIKEFTMARWDRSYLEDGHCFYGGNDAITNRIVLARDAVRPVDDKHWVWRDPNKVAECYDDPNLCWFVQ